MGEVQLLAASSRKWPQVAAKLLSRQVAATCRYLPQVAVEEGCAATRGYLRQLAVAPYEAARGYLRQVAASCLRGYLRLLAATCRTAAFYADPAASSRK